jgi:1-deoxy-D-xylulose 5-phosphate reductoisomerase
MPPKHLALLGATGSIGQQCLQIAATHPDKIRIDLLSAHNNVALLVEQAIQFQPNVVVLTNPEHRDFVAAKLAAHPIKVYAGQDSLCEALAWSEIDMVVNALVGFSGLLPSLAALKARKALALANKESLVAGGALVMEAARLANSPILPVDSEHSAIFQCLLGERSPIEKLILTASGGPFLHSSPEQIARVSKADALKHPNWNMGAKVSIDSASMMNKGLEVIEAHWLFGVPAAQIEVLVHPQSIIHSMVQFEDGSIKAQLSQPDMRLPIQFALSFPQRWSLDTARANFPSLHQLQFLAPDLQKFPCLALAYEALARGGNVPCALNAANEVAVAAFLQDALPFHRIPVVIEKTLAKIDYSTQPSLSVIQDTDAQARGLAQNLLQK